MSLIPLAEIGDRAAAAWNYIASIEGKAESVIIQCASDLRSKLPFFGGVEPAPSNSSSFYDSLNNNVGICYATLAIAATAFVLYLLYNLRKKNK